MNLVDSSAWIEYVRNGPNAAFFAPAIEKPSELIVPTSCLYEVFKKIASEADERDAMTVIVHMNLGRVVDFNHTLAIEAARISRAHKLAMADSIIYATAQSMNAVLWTQDEHFQGMPDVKFRAKVKG